MSEVKSLLGEFRKDINAVSKQVKDLKVAPAPKDPPDPTDPPVDPPAPKDPPDPKANTELQKLQRQIQTLTDQTKQLTAERETERTQRLETERVSSVKNAMADIAFRDEGARSLFYNSVIGSIKRDADGNLVAETKDGPVMYDAYVKQQAEQAPYLLQPQGSGGAGARSGKPGASGSNAGPQLEDITPAKLAAMKPEEKAALYKTIGDAANQAFAGNA